MNEHPPIPPNCPYFAPQSEGPGEPESWWLMLPDKDPIQCVCHCDSAWRPVIACIASQYWGLEHDKMSAHIPPRDDMAARATYSEKMADVYEHIVAWMRWGGLCPK